MKNKFIEKILKDKKIDGILIHNPVNTFYLTKFHSSNSFILITKDGKKFYFTDTRYYNAAEIFFQESEFMPILLDWKSIDSMIRHYKIDNLVIESDFWTLNQYDKLRETLKNINLVSTDFSKLRIFKTRSEIMKIKDSIILAEKVMDYLVNNIKIGMTEIEVEKMATIQGLKLGAEKNSFDFIVATGVNGDSPHYKPNNSKVQDNQLITIDMGFVKDGYCSDITRTFKTSESIDPKLEEIYKVVLKANKAVTKIAKPGMSAKELDKVARDIIEKAGYGKYFGHGLGHGLGIEIHEAPTVSFKSIDKLEPGMVISNEPGIYVPGLGGVRIEDILVITKEGNENLTNFSKRLIKINN